jgi:hypothetical protein
MTGLPEILVKHKGKVLDAGTIIDIVNEATRVPYRPVSIAHIEPRESHGFVFAVERYAACLDELKPLHAAHWLETEKHRHALPFNPDYDGMLHLEAVGKLALVTIRKDGELVGQTTMKLYQSMHSQTLTANEDSLFLRSDQRGSLGVMLAFIRYGIEAMERLGVAEIRVSSKIINGADKLMVRAGFKPFAIQLVKMTGRAQHETDIAA